MHSTDRKKKSHRQPKFKGKTVQDLTGIKDGAPGDSPNQKAPASVGMNSAFSKIKDEAGVVAQEEKKVEQKSKGGSHMLFTVNANNVQGKVVLNILKVLHMAEAAQSYFQRCYKVGQINVMNPPLVTDYQDAVLIALVKQLRCGVNLQISAALEQFLNVSVYLPKDLCDRIHVIGNVQLNVGEFVIPEVDRTMYINCLLEVLTNRGVRMPWRTILPEAEKCYFSANPSYVNGAALKGIQLTYEGNAQEQVVTGTIAPVALGNIMDANQLLAFAYSFANSQQTLQQVFNLQKFEPTQKGNIALLVDAMGVTPFLLSQTNAHHGIVSGLCSAWFNTPNITIMCSKTVGQLARDFVMSDRIQ